MNNSLPLARSNINLSRRRKTTNITSRKSKKNINNANVEQFATTNLEKIGSRFSNTRTKSTITIAKLKKKKNNNSNSKNNNSEQYYLLKKISILFADKGKKMHKLHRYNVEWQIYKMLKQFIFRNISPHVITGGDHYSNEDKIKNKTDYYIINETFDDITNPKIYDILTLYDFILKYLNNPKFKFAIINILFQLVYTLSCFNLINLTHNDLHPGNILLFIYKENNIFNPDFTLKNTNTYKYELGTDETEIKLFDLGINAYIFDFDGSNKNEATNPNIVAEFKKPINQPKYYTASQKIQYNNQNNNFLDIFKLLFVLINYILNLLKKHSGSPDIDVSQVNEGIRIFIELFGNLLHINL